MKWRIPLSRLFVLGLALLGIMACSPLDYIVLSRSSDQAPTPEVKQLPVTPVSQPPAPVASAAPSATLAPGSNGPQVGWKTFTSVSYQYALSYPSDWTVVTEKAGTLGEAKNIERVTFKQPNYGKPNQSSTIIIEASQGAYATTAQCQGQSVVVSGVRGCRRSMPKGQNPAQEIVLFQTPASGNSPSYFYVQLVYDDAQEIETLNRMLATWKFTVGASPSAAPSTAGAVKTYKSTQYAYVVSYPANWSIKVQTIGPTGPGRDPENVFLTSPGGGLPQVQIMALKGAPPITGLENCDKNLQFRGIPACGISLSGGQQPATQMLLFQIGGAYFHMAIQYEMPSQLAVFEDIVKSFQFSR